MFQTLCGFFGCLRLPFDKSLLLRDLFPPTAHQAIQARLNFALQARFPTLITGDVGTGKATAVRAFVQSLDANLYQTAYLPNPNFTVQALFAQMVRSTASFAVTNFPSQRQLPPPRPGRTLAQHPRRPVPTGHPPPSPPSPSSSSASPTCASSYGSRT